MEARKITTGTWKNTPRTQELIQEVLDSGRTSYGEKSRRFENEFAHIHGCNYGTLSNSGTSSLHVALQTLKELHGWADGDEVIVPATTFVATANVVIHNNMVPVFVDIEPDYYGINVDLIEEKITDKTRAIIAVHLFGQPCNMAGVMHHALRHDLRVIEDSCETMFVSFQNKRVGSIGDIGCFSMYNAHLISAGVGGISTTNNKNYAAKMRSLVNHGLSIENLNLDENMQPQPMIGRRFDFDSIGHSFRLTEFEAAVALAQLENYKVIKRTRSINASQITTLLSKYIYKAPHARVEEQHAWMMYPIVINKRDGKNYKKEPVTDFLNTRGVETRDMLPLINQTSLNNYFAEKEYPISKWITESGFYVGCHQNLSAQDIIYLSDQLEDATPLVMAGIQHDN